MEALTTSHRQGKVSFYSQAEDHIVVNITFNQVVFCNVSTDHLVGIPKLNLINVNFYVSHEPRESFLQCIGESVGMGI